MGSFSAKKPGAEMSAPENFDLYLAPKEVSPRYNMAYTTFLKHLNPMVEKGDYPRGAFWVTKSQPSKREHKRIKIHHVHGIAFLDDYFDPRRNAA